MNAVLLLCALLASSAGATGFGEPQDGLAARLEFLEPERLAAGNLRLRLTLRNVGKIPALERLAGQPLHLHGHRHDQGSIPLRA